MPIATLDQLKGQLNITPDIGAADDVLLARKLAAAQNHVERLLGFRIADQFPPEGEPPVSTVPPDLVEAVLQLAAWWYEAREAAGEGARDVPFNVREIVTEYRAWSF